MSALDEQLQSLRVGKSRRIRGINVRRDVDGYSVDGDLLSLAEAVQRLSQETTKVGGIDYDRTVFLEKTASDVLLKWHRCRTKVDHQTLLAAVQARKNHLWYATVLKRDNGTYYASHPHILDWDSIPEKKDETPPNPKLWNGGLSCPFCRKSVSSTQGRTLHVKHSHPDRLDEYFGLVGQATKEDDVVDHLEDSTKSDKLLCPFCGHKTTSTPGRTLHVKAKHPDKLGEYEKLINGSGRHVGQSCSNSEGGS